MTGSFPLISVIVPCYKNEEYIRRTVSSLVSQTYPNLEIICVDDGSPDNAGKILDELAEQNTNLIVLHQTNKGTSAARNLGVQRASGEYIGFIDGDDTAEPEMYQVLYENLIKNKADISMINAVYTYEDSEITESVFHFDEGMFTNLRQLEMLLLHEGSSSVCTCLFPAQLCKDNQFDEGKLNEDFLFWINIIPQVHSIFYQNIPMYHYYVHSRSLSRSGFSKNMIDMVDNTRYVQKIVVNQYPEYTEAMERFLLYQRLVYLEYIPLNLIRNKSREYTDVIREICAYKDRIKSNRYLKENEKRYLYAFINYPILTRSYFGLRRFCRKCIDSISKRY